MPASQNTLEMNAHGFAVTRPAQSTQARRSPTVPCPGRHSAPRRRDRWAAVRWRAALRRCSPVSHDHDHRGNAVAGRGRGSPSDGRAAVRRPGPARVVGWLAGGRSAAALPTPDQIPAYPLLIFDQLIQETGWEPSDISGPGPVSVEWDAPWGGEWSNAPTQALPLVRPTSSETVGGPAAPATYARVPGARVSSPASRRMRPCGMR